MFLIFKTQISSSSKVAGLLFIAIGQIKQILLLFVRFLATVYKTGVLKALSAKAAHLRDRIIAKLETWIVCG